MKNGPNSPQKPRNREKYARINSILHEKTGRFRPVFQVLGLIKPRPLELEADAEADPVVMAIH